jgi:transposase
MTTERLSMRKAREILRQVWALKLGYRDVARSLDLSLGVVSATVRRAVDAALDWAQIEALSEDELELRLYGSVSVPDTRPQPDCPWIHTERRRPGVTLALLHLEYLERHPGGYRYTQFCEYYRRWLKGRRTSMRQVHRGGEKAFVDYAGQKPHIVDPRTGECRDVELFVSALGASNYTYAEASYTQQVEDWISSNGRALVYFGGVPGAIVCDQLKSGVTVPCRYEPGIQRTFEEFGRHYGTVVLPARPAKPRDKAKVEVAVQVAERWILARLRNETFFSLDALNERIAELREDLNNRFMRVYRATRRELFEKLDRAALKPLPSRSLIPGVWLKAGVNIDYHIEVDGHYYSVPHGLFQEEVEVHRTALTVEIFHRGTRIASHQVSRERGRHTTISEHMPKAHREHLEWSPSRMIGWAASIGPQTKRLVEAILADRPHPEMGYRSCLGILRLARRDGNGRLEAACGRALAVGARSYRHVDSILKNGLDRIALSEPTPARQEALLFHENLRGSGYYQEGGLNAHGTHDGKAEGAVASRDGADLDGAGGED